MDSGEPRGPQELGFPLLSDQILRLWTLEDLTRFQVNCGRQLRQADGVLWAVSNSRFWVPLMTFDPIPGKGVHWPSHTALGFQAIVSEPERATGWVQYLLVPDLPTYGVARIGKVRRREIRRAAEHFEFRVLDTPEILMAQGWRTLSEAASRSGQSTPGSEAVYRGQWEAIYNHEPPLVIAALREGVLHAYMVSYAAGGHVSFEQLAMDASARAHKAGAALYWLHLSLWSSVPGVEFASFGRPYPERDSIDFFKKSMGAQIAILPVVGRMRAPVRWFLKRQRPHAYERLVGMATASETGGPH